MFDMASMQHECKHDDFLDMLSFYLNDKSIRCIVYENMFISELLFHKYNIVISEIFDLHVAFRHQFKSIESLQIEDLIFELKPDLYLVETPNDELDWTQRPLSAELKYKAIAETCLLLDIYEYLIDHVMSDLSRASKHCNYPLLVNGNQEFDLNNNKNEHKASKQVNSHDFNGFNQQKTNTSPKQMSLLNSSSSLSSSRLTLNNKPSANGFGMREKASQVDSPKNSYSNTIKTTSTTTCNLANEPVDESLHKTDKYVSSQSHDYYSGKYIFVPAGYSGHKTSRKKRDILKSKSHY